MKAWEFALLEIGEKEIAGIDNNKRILLYSKEIGASWVSNDETPWCAIFIQWCLKQAGLKYSYMANARYFLKYGKRTENPKLGDIVVLWRGSKNSTLGHVGFFIKENKNSIWILGGNQNNEVNIMQYSKSQVLDYRSI